MPNRDYIPDSAINIRNWCDTQLKLIDAIAARIGWPESTLAAYKARLTRLRDAAQVVLDAQNAVTTALGLLSALKDLEVPELRRDVNNLKFTRGFTDGDARTLDLLTGNASFDQSTFKPILSVESLRGHNSLTSRKYAADALNLYMRRKGQTEWQLIAAKRVRFPCDDDTPPLVAGQPEEREYQAHGVIADEEIGQPSDIVSAVFRP